MLFSFLFKSKSKSCAQENGCAVADFIRIRNKYSHYIFAVEKKDEEKFFSASPDELIACKPLAKNGSMQRVKAVLFKRNELNLVA
ncbi:MAG: hypothetical protein ACXWEY_05175 [Bacteroidia bacterium]